MAYTFNNLFFEATRRCNLSCPGCMAGSDDEALVEERLPRELSTDEIEEHVLKTAREVGIETITWSGGEFVLRPDAIDLVERATAYGYASIIATNGTTMDRERLSALKSASGDTLVIAVGINSIGDDSTAIRDADCDSSLQVLERCHELGIQRNVVVTVGQHNSASLNRTLDWLEKHHIPYNRSPFTARGSGRKLWDKLRLTREIMEEQVHPALRSHPGGYISYTPFFLSPDVHERYSKGACNVTVPQNPSIGCWCGTWLALGPEGDLSPCAILLDDVRCGNVRDASMAALIDESPVFQAVLDRERLEGRCGRCRYKFTCGGCRAMAFYEHGNIMAEDPTCFFEPVDETTVCEHEEETNRMFRRFVFMVRHAHGKRTLFRNDEEAESGDPSATQ